MDTCVVVARQYASSSRGKSHALAGSGCFREINCSRFQSGTGLLPAPFNNTRSSSNSTSSTPVARSPSAEPQLPNCSSPETQLLKRKTSPRSSPIPIKSKGYMHGLRFHELSFSEVWAGPTYSNSPPPSSVPIPKFSTRSKPTRTVSLELPVIAKEVLQLQPLVKSAPSSLRNSHFSSRCLFGTPDNATKALRRILNLDISDE